MRRTAELDPRRQPTGGTEDRSDSFGGGKLPQIERLKLPVRDYLAAVLPGLADVPIQRLPELTPFAWANRHR